jgi:RNA polymerase sigma-70 factor (ECF subfamily)
MDQKKWVEDAVERYEKPLLKYAYNIVKDAECAREIVQDTFMRLFNQKQSKINGYLAQWLFAVCRNHGLKTLVKEKRYVHMDDVELCEKQVEHFIDVDFNLSEFGNLLIKHLNRLPKKQLAVITARYWNNLSYRQIGEQLGLTSDNVGFILSTVIKRLRKSIKAENNALITCI